MEDAIRRPDAPDHFMVLKPIARRVVVRLPDGSKLAESTKAVRLMEAGRTLYDPVVYLPMDDVSAPLTKQENSTFCPLKGDASYFGLQNGAEIQADLAWSYEEPFDFSKDIKDLVAFYPDRVILEEHPI